MHFFSSNSIAEIPFVVLLAGVIFTGVWISNIIYDHGVPNYISRKIGHSAGGLAFLAAIVFSSAGWPIIIAAASGIVILVLRKIKPAMLRGVGGTGRDSGALAEVWFPFIAVPVFIIAWLWLGRPEIAVASLLFMAWGDGVTGLVRSQVYKRPVKGLWGSLAMLAVCLVVSWVFIQPFWAGAAVSLVAVAVEWSFGDNGIIKWADDNWAVPLFSMGVLLGLIAALGK
jgi:phytol kinase